MRCERDLSGPSSTKHTWLENFEIKWDRNERFNEGKAQEYAFVPLSECGIDTEVLKTLRECSKMFSRARDFQYGVGEERDRFYESVLKVLVEQRGVFSQQTDAQYLYVRFSLFRALDTRLSFKN